MYNSEKFFTIFFVSIPRLNIFMFWLETQVFSFLKLPFSSLSVWLLGEGLTSVFFFTGELAPLGKYNLENKLGWTLFSIFYTEGSS